MNKVRIRNQNSIPNSKLLCDMGWYVLEPTRVAADSLGGKLA